MPYKFKAGESVPESIRRIVTEEMDHAAGQLDGTAAKNREEGIHEARKSVKKTRAMLRLVRSDLGAVRQRENTRLREMGRKLSELRDAGAIVGTFDELRKASQGAPGVATLDSIRAGLVERRDQAMEQAGVEARLKIMAKSFRATAKRVKSWPLETSGFGALRTGLEESFRDGRKALGRARKQGRPEDFHEWRKRTKDHWYHIRLLEPLWSDAMQAQEKSLKDLETWLGEDHNLVVLRAKIVSEPDLHADAKAVILLNRLIDRRQKELRKSALAAGARIFEEEKPRQFVRRMKRLWDAWQAAPRSPEKAEDEKAPEAAAPPKKKPAGSPTPPQKAAQATSAA